MISPSETLEEILNAWVIDSFSIIESEIDEKGLSPIMISHSLEPSKCVTY